VIHLHSKDLALLNRIHSYFGIGNIFIRDNSGRYKPGQPRPEESGKPSQQIEVTDIKNNTTTSYNSMSEAARALNLPSYKAISDYIKNNQKKPYKGRYTFQKI
jgi:hypothetical protein